MHTKFSFFLVVFFLISCQSDSYDIVIENGLVHDGSGSESKSIDIAIIGNQIVKVGKINSENALLISKIGLCQTLLIEDYVNFDISDEVIDLPISNVVNETQEAILEKAKAKNVQIHIPVDVLAADDFSNDANTQVVDVKQIPDGWQGLDSGPKSLEIIKRIILDSKTILWNGPLGVFEMESFANGTISLGNYIAESTKNGAFSLVGGGDSVAAVKQFGFEPKMSYVSTGGGAMLEMLEGKTLPGIAAILND